MEKFRKYDGITHYELIIGIDKYIIDDKPEHDGKIHINRFDMNAKCLNDAYMDDDLGFEKVPIFDTFKDALKWIRKYKDKLL